MGRHVVERRAHVVRSRREVRRERRTVERIFDSRGKGQRRWGVLVTVLVVDVDDDEVVVVVSPAIDVEDLGCCAL